MAAVVESSPALGNMAFQDQGGSKGHAVSPHLNGLKNESTPTFKNDNPLDGFPADEELPEPICGGCKKLIDEESADAGVIHFATQLWHVDCFRCAKCRNPVTTDRDDILLLSDGHPICGQCNYSCQICNLPIMEEAIMTGDESYHASCFVCRSCRTPIAELVFAKTSQGIYCMKCHNQRVARSRRHAEKKRAAAAATAGSVSGNSIAPNTPDPEKMPITPAGKVDARSPSIKSQTLPGSPYAEATNGQPAVPPKNENSLSGSNSNANLSPFMQNTSSFNLPRPSSAGQGTKRPLKAPIPDTMRTNGRRDARPATAESSSSDLANLTGTSASGSFTRTDAQKLAQQSTLAKLEGGGNTDSASPLLASAFEHAASSEKLKRLAERNKLGKNSPSKTESESKTKNFAGLKILTDSRDSKNGSVVPVSSRIGASSPHHENDDDDAGDSTNDGLLPAQYKRASRLGVNEQFNPSSNIPKSPSKESRLSRAFSFYDPDIIGLMDSFGKFDSYEEFSLDVDVPAGKQKKADGSSRKLEGPTSASNAETTEILDEEHLERDVGKKSESKKGKDDPSASLTKVSETMRKSIRKAHDGHVNMDTKVLESMLDEIETTGDRLKTLQRKYERIRRASQQAAQGFSSAREEYEQEVQARYDAEAEMLNLKRQLHLQATKLAGVATEKDKHEVLQRRNTEVKSSIKGMEKDLARLKGERDLILAEVMGFQDMRKAGLNPSVGGQEETDRRGFINRFDGIKEKYHREIEELTAQRDTLLVEIEELRQSRDVFAEETTSLNARNEELNSTLALLQRRVEHAQASEHLIVTHTPASLPSTARTAHSGFGFGFGGHKNGKASLSANSTPIVADSMANAHQHSFLPDSAEHLAIAAPIPVTKVEAAPRKFKWMKAPKLTSESARQAGQHLAAALPGVSPPVPPKSANAASSSSSFSTHQQSNDAQSSSTSGLISHHHKHSQEMGGSNGANGTSTNAAAGEIVVKEHLFQPFNVIRPVRCFACQKNMWGQSELKCQFCGQACHVRCLQNLPISCNQPFSRSDDTTNESQGPPIFGRGLAEHLQEAEHGTRKVPLVVEKCVETVELQGMDYEGIYRKSGGTSQLKIIQQLFEKGQPFNLNDRDRFNDISAITSVLKNYFRELPEPLLTFELHEKFIECVEAKNVDVNTKRSEMGELVHSLPKEHFDTLRFLIAHLHRVRERSEENRMSSRNLGVVFGPTLMRSHDPALEFAHMGGKAMTIEFMIDHSDIFD